MHTQRVIKRGVVDRGVGEFYEMGKTNQYNNITVNTTSILDSIHVSSL